MPIPWLGLTDIEFPSADHALDEPNGLLAVGGDLSVARLLNAYRNGIFPWYEDGQPILWWSPDPRMVLFPAQLKISHSLRKLLAKQAYTVSLDQAFSQVMQHCAAARRESTGTWITDAMRVAYTALHENGIAHSVEVWWKGELVGGLYGVALGQIFFGESMFSKADNTSKVALVYLVKQLLRWNFELIDCQVSSEHLLTLGAREVSRASFQQLLRRFVHAAGRPGRWQFESELISEIARIR